MRPSPTCHRLFFRSLGGFPGFRFRLGAFCCCAAILVAPVPTSLFLSGRRRPDSRWGRTASRSAATSSSSTRIPASVRPPHFLLLRFLALRSRHHCFVSLKLLYLCFLSTNSKRKKFQLPTTLESDGEREKQAAISSFPSSTTRQNFVVLQIIYFGRT